MTDKLKDRKGNLAPIDGLVPQTGVLRAAWRDWAKREVSQWLSISFVTLNFKSKVISNAGRLIILDQQAACSEIVRFGRRIDRAVFRNAVQRFNKRVRRIPFLEYGADRGWHCHLTIEKPEGMADERFIRTVEQSWSKSEWGIGLPDIRTAESNVVGYLTKYRSKAEMEAWSDTIILEAVVANTKYPTLPTPRIC